MNILSPGKFEIALGDETKIVTVSLGLKTEVFRLITAAQLEIAGLHKQLYLQADLAAKIQEKDQEVKLAESKEEAEETVELLKEELEILYSDALAELETRQTEAVSKMALDQIGVTEKIFVKALICLLSPRDAEGNITKAVTESEILWSQEYSEAQEELSELLLAVVDYVTSALKKISEINLLVQSVSQAVTVEKE